MKLVWQNLLNMDVRLLFGILLLGFTSAGKHDIYAGYSVHGVIIRDYPDLQLLHDLEAPLELDVWQHGAPDGQRDAVVMVSADHARAFLDRLDAAGVTHYLNLADLPKAFEDFDQDIARYKQSKAGREAVPYDDYPRYDEINTYIERIASQYPDIVTLVNAGQSYEGREIKYLKISTTNFTDASKPIYYMDAMIHAREWVTTPVTLYSIHRLVEDLRDQDRDLLEGTDWIIHPMVNPDGYEYTHTNARLWRRTRSINLDASTTCVGVDANRNFDASFNTLGVSNNPCSDIYPGVLPFSEPETIIVRDILHEHLDRIQVYQNIHSFGNWILYGFGNTSLPANGMALHHVGAAMGAAIDALKLPQAPFYLVGNSALLLYSTSGSAQDYGQQIGVPFSYTLELPEFGHDFRVPPEYIAQINEETWQGIAAQARLAKLHYNLKIRNQAN